GGWCQPVSASSDVNGGSVQIWVHPPSATPSRRCQGSVSALGCMEVVAVGTLHGVSRRIDATATTASGQQIFSDAGVKAQDSITFDSNDVVHSGVATNGNITLAANAKQCGIASVGIGHTLTLSSNAQYNTDTACTTPASG